MNEVIAVYCRAKEARADCGRIMTKEDLGFWVLTDPEGWVPATAYRGDKEKPPKNVLTWYSFTEAKNFMKTWKGYSRYYVPKSWEIVRLKIKTKEVFSHYELC
jgi:hypothetical protein